MKKIFIVLVITFLQAEVSAQQLQDNGTKNMQRISLQSRIPELKLSLLHIGPVARAKGAVLFIHGASFPSALAFGFRMNNFSWMDDLAKADYDVYALDFLGYGESDRYPEMTTSLHDPTYSVGKEVSKDVDIAVEHILKRTGLNKIYLIGHSWGATVCAYYATQSPEKIKRLVLFAPFVERDAKVENVNISAYHELTPDERVKQFIHGVEKPGEIILEPQVLTTWKDQWLASDKSSQTRNPPSVRFPGGWEYDYVNCMQGNCYYDPSKITVPTLLIRGEWDQLPNAEDAQRLFSNLSNASLKRYVVIERSSHVAHLEKSRRQLYSEVKNFLNEDTMNESKMIAVIFEVIPNKKHSKEYLDIAAKLKPELEKIEGFISIERFESLSNPGKLLSLSYWESEEAVKQWRNLEEHRMAQKKGREYIFDDYTLRVAHVIRNYGKSQRDEAPLDNKLFHKQ